MNIGMHLIFPETRVIGLHFFADRSIFSQICCGLEKTHLFCNRVRFGRSRSSKVDDFSTIESAYATSYQSVIVTVVLLPRF